MFDKNEIQKINGILQANALNPNVIGPMRWYSKTGTQYRDKLFYIRGVSDEKTV